MRRLRMYHDAISAWIFLVLAVSGMIYLVFFTNTLVGIYTVVHCVFAVAHYKRWELQLAYRLSIEKRKTFHAEISQRDSN